MRNALILLAVVALLILAVGALNNGTAFEIDYVAGTMSQVSLFWVSLVVAAVVFVAGAAAAWFALAGAAGGRRKLEAELQATYERLRGVEREAEDAGSAAAAAEARAVAAEATAAASAAPEAAVAAAPEETTAVAAEVPTVVVVPEEQETVVAAEPETVVAAEDETVVAAEQTAMTLPPAAPGEGAAPVDGEPGEDASDAKP